MSNSHIRLTLHPDQDGAKQLREQYGERLVCVRYRYDGTTKERWKTVELIIAKRAWEPPPPRWPAATLVALHVAAQERELRQRVKSAGGKWNPQEVVWELSYGQVVVLGMTERIVSKVNGDKRNTHLLIDEDRHEYPSTNRE